MSVVRDFCRDVRFSLSPTNPYRDGWVAAMIAVRAAIDKQGAEMDEDYEDQYERGWNEAGHRLQVNLLSCNWAALSGGKVKPVYRVRARSRHV